MEELVLEIIKYDNLPPKGDRIKIPQKFSVSLDGQKQFDITEEDIEEIYNTLSPNGSQTIFNVFLEKVKELNQKTLEFLSNKFRLNQGQKFLITILSEDPKILGLPWDIIRYNKERLSYFRNVVIRRCLNNKDLFDLLKLSNCIFCATLSSFNDILEENKDLSLHILGESKNFKENFKANANLFLDINRDQFNNKIIKSKKNIVHFAGHGNEKGFPFGCDMITCEDFKKINCELLFLNFCKSSLQTNSLESLIYKILKASDNVKYIIGMFHDIESDYAVNFSGNFYSKLIKDKGDVLNAFHYAITETKSNHTRQDCIFPVLYQK